MSKKKLDKLIPRDKEILFACIGTDRSTGDSLGPLVGTALSKLGLTVIGTLHEPLHALNIHENIERVKVEYPNHFIVAIDACLSKSERIGLVTIKSGPLKPGAAVNKDLPLIGDVSIKGIVNVSGYMEHQVLQSTRLSMVMDMAEEIAGMCEHVMKKRKFSDVAVSEVASASILKGGETVREIKFRAWDNVKNEMYYTGEEDLVVFIFSSSGIVADEIIPDDSVEGFHAERLEHLQYMQFTGLQDKNGVEIYEGDIVEYTRIIYVDCSRVEIEDIQEPITGEVYYAEGLWLGIKLINRTGKLFLPGQLSVKEANPELEVIGNIYQHPHLLEVR